MLFVPPKSPEFGVKHGEKRKAQGLCLSISFSEGQKQNAFVLLIVCFVQQWGLTIATHRKVKRKNCNFQT